MKNAALIDLALDPVPFVHHVVRRDHPNGWQCRKACPCGWVSGWYSKHGRPLIADHPDGIATRSRTDLTPVGPRLVVVR